jgi:hypothetical protein
MPRLTYDLMERRIDAIFDHDLALAIWPPVCFRRNLSSRFILDMPERPFLGWGARGAHLLNSEMLSKIDGWGTPTHSPFFPFFMPSNADIVILFSKFF